MRGIAYIVSSIRLTPSKYGGATFVGIHLDFAIQRTEIEVPQAIAYCTLVGIGLQRQ